MRINTNGAGTGASMAARPAATEDLALDRESALAAMIARESRASRNEARRSRRAAQRSQVTKLKQSADKLREIADWQIGKAVVTGIGGACQFASSCSGTEGNSSTRAMLAASATACKAADAAVDARIADVQADKASIEADAKRAEMEADNAGDDAGDATRNETAMKELMQNMGEARSRAMRAACGD